MHSASERLPVVGMIMALAVPGPGTDAAQGATVSVTVTGEVEFNQINPLPLGAVNAGDPVTLSFDVDSADFVDGVLFPTRGYRIIESSFSLQMGSVTIGLQNPLPAIETPYFVLRDNDPAVDGFLLAGSPDVGFPDGVPIDQTGVFEQFRMVYATTYDNDPLPSLDILDAVGAYDFTGLTVFSMRIADGPVDSAMGMVFAQMTVAAASPGDFDGDGDVDLNDHRFFTRCLAGPDVQPGPSPPAQDCLDAFDFDLDADVDHRDSAVFTGSFTG